MQRCDTRKQVTNLLKKFYLFSMAYVFMARDLQFNHIIQKYEHSLHGNDEEEKML